jgi:hypothetical protein
VEWAAPDAPADAPDRSAGAPPRASRPEEPARRLPELAPMTLSDILDGGFAILRRAPATILGFTAIFVIPIQILAAWLNRGVEGFDVEEAVQQSNSSFQSDLGASGGGSGWSALVLEGGSKVALVIVAAAIARLVSAWYVGRDLTTGALLRGTVPLLWALVASCVLVHVLEGVAIIGLGILPLAVMTWFLVTAPVIGAERIGPIAAMRRSARLVSRRFWNVLGAALVGWLVEQLFLTAIGGIPTFVSLFVGTEGVAWILPAAVGVVSGIVTMPLVAGITVLIYLDLRVRTEGLDLEMRAIDAFPATT